MAVDFNQGVQITADANIAYFRDNKNLSPAEVLQLDPHRWTLNKMGTPSFGFDKNVYWFRLVFKHTGQTQADGIFEIAYPQLDYVDIYKVIDGAPELIVATGDTVPFDQRLLNSRNFAIALSIEPQQTTELLIRVHTQGSLQFPIAIYDGQSYFEHEQRVVILEGAFFGILVIMATYNLFLLIALRDISYFLYSALAISIMLFQFSMHGFAFQFLWPNSPQLNHIALLIFMWASIFLGTKFTDSFLNLKKHHYNLHLITHFITLLVLATIIGYFWLPYHLIITFTSIMGPGISIFCIGASYYAYYKGQKHARFMLLGWTSFMLGVLVYGLNKLGVIPVTFLTEYGVQLGSVADMALLSFALADRINTEREAKITAQQARIEQEKLARRAQEIHHQEELQARKKIVEAEAANAAKSQFLAMMSHEIRTPMNSIIGFMELTLEDRNLQPKNKRYLSIAHNSAKFLLQLINDILDLSKIESGKLELDQKPFSLITLITNIYELMEVSAQDKNLQLKLQIPTHLAPAYIGDEFRLQQILLNLVANAIKFTHTGSVTIRIEEPGDNNLVSFSVIDTGIGIPNDKITEILEPFTQADASMTRRFGGTGLGTTISYQLIHLMGGDLNITSEVGKGSHFRFSIPLPATTRLSVNNPAPPKQATRKPLNILIVDDIPQNIELVKVKLEKLGHTVTSATSGQHAMQVAEISLFDLILMDIQMPGMDGIETTKRLRLMNNSNRSAPIIAMTASVMKEDQTTYFEAGMDNILAKPINFDQLEALVDNLVDQPATYSSVPGIIHARPTQQENSIATATQQKSNEGKITTTREAAIAKLHQACQDHDPLAAESAFTTLLGYMNEEDLKALQKMLDNFEFSEVTDYLSEHF